MGTTVVAAMVPSTAPQMTFANVGDSRIYLIRAGSMEQLSRDDSWASLGVDDTSPGTNLRNVLTKAVGAQEDVQFDIVSHPLIDDDRVLLCSDGLTNMLPDVRILEVVTGRGTDLEGACGDLVEEANRAGGRDNVSVILARYQR
jgi:protein phosphatase